MSRKKFTKDEINLIVERSLKMFGFKHLYQLADIFDISPQDLNNRTNRGTVVKLIEKEAHKRSVDFDLILTGIPSKEKLTPSSGANKLGNQEEVLKFMTPNDISSIEDNRDKNSTYRSRHMSVGSLDFKISDDLQLAAHILESNTQYSNALHLNIHSFARAISAEKRLIKIADEQNALKQELENVKSDIKKLHTENQELKSRIDDMETEPDPGAASAT